MHCFAPLCAAKAAHRTAAQEADRDRGKRHHSAAPPTTPPPAPPRSAFSPSLSSAWLGLRVFCCLHSHCAAFLKNALAHLGARYSHGCNLQLATGTCNLQWQARLTLCAWVGAQATTKARKLHQQQQQQRNAISRAAPTCN